MMYVLEYSVYHLKPYGHNTVLKVVCDQTDKGHVAAVTPSIIQKENATVSAGLAATEAKEVSVSERTLPEPSDENRLERINRLVVKPEADKVTDVNGKEVNSANEKLNQNNILRKNRKSKLKNSLLLNKYLNKTFIEEGS